MFPSLELMRKLLGGNCCFTEYDQVIEIRLFGKGGPGIYELIWIVVLWDIGDGTDTFF